MTEANLKDRRRTADQPPDAIVGDPPHVCVRFNGATLAMRFMNKGEAARHLGGLQFYRRHRRWPDPKTELVPAAIDLIDEKLAKAGVSPTD